ncbi:MAG: MFS transporter [Paracoccus sp. (in: a-proteobacteria)]
MTTAQVAIDAGGDPVPAAPAPASPPAAPAYSWPVALAYIGVSLFVALTQGVAQGFVSTNIPQVAGNLGVTTTQATWLTVAFTIPRVALPLMLVKIRMQFGLRRFAEIAVAIYLVVSLISIEAIDLRSAVLVQALSGMSAAPLSTLAFMYMLEPLPPQWKMRLGLPLVMAAISAGPMLARVVSPPLLAGSGLAGLHALGLGLAALALGLVYYLPLTSPPRVKAIAPLDIVSWLLIAAGFGGLSATFTMGAIYWWTDTAWLGMVFAASIGALTLAVIVELHRKAPLLDIRWLASPTVVHLTVTLLLFRLILSEQSAGAPRMFQVLGVTQNQLMPLFAVLIAATFAGALALIPFMKPGNVPRLHLVALAMIGIGAYMDSHATVDTRPAQMMLSQAMIAFASTLYLAPAMMQGLLSALARGPNYILSFIIIFLSTQSLGGVIGSGAFVTFINHREAVHMQVLREELTTTSPMLVQQIAARSAALAPQIADGAMRRAQAVVQIAGDATTQAFVLAYNDAYRLIALVAAGALAALVLHMFRDRLAASFRPASPAAPASSQINRTEPK